MVSHFTYSCTHVSNKLKMCLFDAYEPMMFVLVLQTCMFDLQFPIFSMHCMMFICEIKLILNLFVYIKLLYKVIVSFGLNHSSTMDKVLEYSKYSVLVAWTFNGWTEISHNKSLFLFRR